MTALVPTQPESLAPLLMERREMLNFDRARTYLAGRLRARTPQGAAEYLEIKAGYPPDEYDRRLRIAVQVCDLYRMLFPRQYAASQTPAYSLAREQELYLLADRHLFPLGPVEQTLRREPSFYMPCITVKSLQEHDWRDGRFDFRRIGTACQLAQVLSGRASTVTGGYGWRDFAAMHGLETLPAPAPPLCAVGWQLFSYSCAVSDTPLRWLPAAFHLTNYSTGSAYLDVPGGTFGLDWTPENVAKLLLQRRRAGEVLAAVAEVGAWLDEAPLPHVGAAVMTWNAAAEVEAQSPYPNLLGGPDELFVVPEMRDLYARMEERL